MFNILSFNRKSSDTNNTDVGDEETYITQRDHSKRSLPPDGEDGIENATPLKIARFEVEEDKGSDWNLPDSLLQYATKYMNIKVTDKDMKEKILLEDPVPLNMKTVPDLDGYMKQLLIDHHKHNTLHIEKVLKGIQEKCMYVFGPISRLWDLTEKEKEQLDANDESAIQNFGYIIGLIEKTVMLESQTYQRLMYHRRHNVLSTLIDNGSKVNELLKNNAEILNALDNKFLFGEKFEDILSHTTSTAKKLSDVFTGLKSQPTSSSSKTPFQKSPLPANNTFRGRGQFFSRISQRGKFRISSGSSAKCSNPSRVPKCTSHYFIFNKKRDPQKITSCGSSKIFPSQLGSPDQGQGNFEYGSRSRNPLSFATNTRICTSQLSRHRGEETSQYRNYGDAPEKGYSENRSFSKSNFESNISSSKERWYSKASNQFETFEFVSPISPFQNGKSFSFKGNLTEGGLYGYSGSEGCLFFCTSQPKLSRENMFSMGRDSLPVSVSVFRSWACTSNIYKANEGTYFHNEENKCTPSDLFGRHTINGPKNSGNHSSKGYFNISSTTLRFSSQPEKITTNSSPGYTVPRCNNQLERIELEPPTGESDKDYKSVQINEREIACLSERSNFSDREIDFICNSSTSCSSPIQGYAKAANKRIGARERFCHNDCVNPGSEGRVVMVDSEPSFKQWEKSYPKFQSNSNFIRCLNKRLGCLLSGTEGRGSMESIRKKAPHQFFGVEGCKTSNSNIYQSISGDQVDPSSVRQYDSTCLFEKDGGYQKPKFDRLEQGDLGNFNIFQDHNYFRTYSGETELGGRFPISKCEGLQRVEIESQSVPKSLSSSLGTLHRPVCISIKPSIGPIHKLETRSLEYGKRCLSTRLGKIEKLCVSTLFSDTKGVEQNSSRESRGASSDSPMGDTSLVSNPLTDVNRESNSDSRGPRSIAKSQQGSTSSYREQRSAISGLDNFRKQLISEGISKQASEIIAASRRGSTLSHYESGWRKWNSWCIERKIDPVRCPITDIIEFLSVMFKKGFLYNTVAGYRSAISAFHIPINGQKIGEHPRVSSLLSGMFNLRPPVPKHDFIWDVGIVISYIKSLEENSELKLPILSKKLAILLALTSASRAHEIAYLDIDYLVQHNSVYSFRFIHLTKTARIKKPRPDLTFFPFPEDSKLCVCKCIDEYITRSKSLRGKETRLLISYIKPHNVVGPSTVSRWITDFLTLSGIDTNKFSGHSTRSASSSKAMKLGVPIKEILRKGYWSKESTFTRFYCKEVQGDDDVFQRSILSSGALKKGR